MSYNIIKHLDYTVWANGKLSQILENCDESVFKKATPSSFPSIELTVLHLWSAEQIWINRLKGDSSNINPVKDFEGNREAVLKGWNDSARELKKFIEDKGQDFINSSIEYKNLSGTPFTSRVEDILFHLVNHGTFHRGQIVTMLRANGVTDLSSTDLITFLRL